MGQTVQSVLLKVKGSIGEMSMLVDTMASKQGHIDNHSGDEEELKGCGIG